MLKASFYPSSFSIQKFATEKLFRMCNTCKKKEKKKRCGLNKKNSKLYFTFSTSPYPTPDSFPKSNKGNNCLLDPFLPPFRTAEAETCI